MKKTTVTTIAALMLFAMSVLTTAAFGQCKPTIHYAGCNIEVEQPYLYSTFQWYRNNVPVYQGNVFAIEAIVGVYYCITTTTDGCTSKSRPYNVTVFCGGKQ